MGEWVGVKGGGRGRGGWGGGWWVIGGWGVGGRDCVVVVIGSALWRERV